MIKIHFRKVEHALYAVKQLLNFVPIVELIIVVLTVKLETGKDIIWCVRILRKYYVKVSFFRNLDTVYISISRYDNWYYYYNEIIIIFMMACSYFKLQLGY